MTKTGRKATAALVTVLAMAVGERASANDEPIAATDRGEPTIVLHVVNFAALSHDVLNGARDRVAMVYKDIGVRTVWVDSEEAVRKHLDGGLHLTVMLLPQDLSESKISAEGISNDALGQAHFANGRAYIFCDRVATMLGTKLFAIQLGAVIAHEVGHLVLPEKSHSRSGVMRAEIDVQHAIHLQRFDKTQAGIIRNTLIKPTARATER